MSPVIGTGSSGEAEFELRQTGNLAFRQGRLHEAEVLYTRALVQPSVAADRHLSYGNRAAVRLKQGTYGGALEDAEHAVQLDAEYAKGWYRKALALRGLGRTTDAAAAAEQAARLEPGGADAATLLHDLQAAAARERLVAAQGAGAAGQLRAQSHGREPSAAAYPRALRGGGHAFQHSADGADENLLILMHGLGDKPGPFAAFARRLELPQTASLALAGPLLVPHTGGGCAWHNAFDAGGDPLPAGDPRRQRSLEATTLLLVELLSNLTALDGWPPRKLHLFGFSQGGTAALHTLLHLGVKGVRLGSCVAVSAAMLPETIEALAASTASVPGTKGTPVLITRGEADGVSPAEEVAATVRALKSAGHQTALHTVTDKGHGMIAGPQEMRAVMEFWAAHLSRRPAPRSSDEDYIEIAS